MLKNTFLQDQINVSLWHKSISLSLTKRFITKTNFRMLFGDICIDVKSDWEKYRLAETIKKSTRSFYHE